MIPLSCSNCCYNGLQYGSIGLSAGYCVEHRVVLRQSDETTCPRHLRKDLDQESRERSQRVHLRQFPTDTVQFLRTREPVNGSPATEWDSLILEMDPVGEAVTNYGSFGSKIASLAELRHIPGVRAELAMLSLGRAYVRRCLENKGAWTSGLNVLWWTRKRIADPPDIGIKDLRYQTAASLDRQAELEAWSIVMLRLTFVADIGAAAPPEEPVSNLSTLLELAAEASETPSLDALLQWVKDRGQQLLDQALPYKRYRQLQEELRRKRGNDID